jgi:hypothetical protein
MMTFHVKYRILLWSWMGWGLLLPVGAQTQEYSHPVFDMGFMASAHWEQQPLFENHQALQLVNPNKNMRVTLSFVPGCRFPGRQLSQISGMRGLVCKEKPYDTILNHRHAVMIKGICFQGKEPYRRVVVGIPGNNGLYVMEICCPEECFAIHQAEVSAILGSLRVGA